MGDATLRVLRPVMDTDVIIVGAGPAGLMLAGELCLAGVRPLVLERQPRLRETPKANGFNGQIVELLRYRGLLDRVEAASGRPVRPAPAAPFGGVQLDFAQLADPPMWAVHAPATAARAPARRTRPRTRRRDAPRARGGRGQPGRRDGDRGRARPGRPLPGDRPLPGGLRRRAQQVRDTAGIPFPGTTYPEVNRLGQVTLPDSVTRLDNGDSTSPGWAGSVRVSPGQTAACSGSGRSRTGACSFRPPKTSRRIRR